MGLWSFSLDPSPEAGLLAVLLLQSRYVSIMRFERAKILDLAGHRIAFGQVARRMLVAAGFPGIQREIDHRAQGQSGGQGVTR